MIVTENTDLSHYINTLFGKHSWACLEGKLEHKTNTEKGVCLQANKYIMT